MSQKFQVNQKVRLARSRLVDPRAKTDDLYEVTRLMPANDTGEASYRIRSAGGGERAVSEFEILALDELP